MGLKNRAKNSKNGSKWPKMRQIVVFCSLKLFFSFDPVSAKKMRRCFKSSDIFEKTFDFFHALAVTDFTTLESGICTQYRQFLLGVSVLVHSMQPICSFMGMNSPPADSPRELNI